MTLQSVFEIALAAAALALLARDLHRAWRDRQRRPITLLTAAAIVALLLGTLGGGSAPSPWWLTLPAAVLTWETARGWRCTPRSHRWEAGIGAFATALFLGAIGLALDGRLFATVVIATGAACGMLGLGLLWASRRHEPKPWRANDIKHYERRSHERPKREAAGGD